jgi:hypothetical protein
MNLRVKCHILTALLITRGITLAGTGEKLQQLKVGDDVYTNVTVTMVTATDISFNHSRGMVTAKLKNVDPAMQQHFGFDPVKAKHAEQVQAKNNAQFQAALATSTPRSSASAGSPPEPGTSTPDLVWGTDLPAALERAKAENRYVLILFDGSDWCPASEWVRVNYLNKEDFKAYARGKLELVLVDFPQHHEQSTELKMANAQLSDEYGIHYYPTFILLNADRKKLGGTLGTNQANPKAFIAKLEGFIAR